MLDVTDTAAPLPDYLIPPELLPGMGEWLQAFWDLSSDRQIGMGMGPIPYSSIEGWLDRHTLDDTDSDIFRAVIHEADHAYLAHVNKKSDAATAGPHPDIATAPLNKRTRPKQQVMSMPFTPALFDALFH